MIPGTKSILAESYITVWSAIHDKAAVLIHGNFPSSKFLK
ncbi:hypothetical protein FHS11_001137 [Mucilaginibacter gotjawali]|uniref:Uncharacterized protein n=1 Tax=Mucilaginibacter gotjawali TaxID=1550579 RepID=A0A839SDV0_9SPHI|nr:hypothetical protein [Mucilaginibacter gotjawali]